MVFFPPKKVRKLCYESENIGLDTGRTLAIPKGMYKFDQYHDFL